MEKYVKITWEDPESNTCGNSLKTLAFNPFVFSSKNKKLISSDDTVGPRHQIVAYDLEKLASPIQEHEIIVIFLKKVIQSSIEVHHIGDEFEALEDNLANARPSSPSNNST